MELAIGLLVGLLIGLIVGLVIAGFIGYFVIKKKIANAAVIAADAATGYVKDKAYEAAIAGAKQVKQRWYNRKTA